MMYAIQLRSCGKLSAAGPPSTFPQPPQLRRRRTNVLTMSLDDSVSYLPGTYNPSSQDAESSDWLLATGYRLLANRLAQRDE